MRRLKHSTAALLALLTATAGLAQQDEAGRTARLVIDLVDGSRIHGTPSVTSLPVQKGHVKMDIPLLQIHRIEIQDDHETAIVQLRDGDVRKGVLNLRQLTLETLFGKASIRLEYVRSIQVRQGGGVCLPTAVKQALVLYYPFMNTGEKAEDKSGQKHHGTVHGAKFVAGGQRGWACEFDGIDDYIDVGDPATLQLTKNFTIAAWICTERKSGGGSIVSKTFGNPQQSRRGFEFYVSGVELVSYFWDNSTRYFRGLAKFPCESMSHWHHVVLQHDASLHDHQMRMFLDGTETELRFNYETTSSIPEIRKVAETLKIGCFRPGTAHFKGRLDEILIFNRVLTAEEIKRLYESQK